MWRRFLRIAKGIELDERRVIPFSPRRSHNVSSTTTYVSYNELPKLLIIIFFLLELCILVFLHASLLRVLGVGNFAWGQRGHCRMYDVFIVITFVWYGYNVCIIYICIDKCGFFDDMQYVVQCYCQKCKELYTYIHMHRRACGLG